MLNAVNTVSKKKKAVSPKPNVVLEQTAMRPKDFNRKLPKALIITVKVNGKPIKVLLNTGSMADFLSTTIVDQLRLKKEVLAKPLPLQMAVHGSQLKINFSATVDFEYQDISCKR
jgi:hypothetical protein